MTAVLLGHLSIHTGVFILTGDHPVYRHTVRAVFSLLCPPLSPSSHCIAQCLQQILFSRFSCFVDVIFRFVPNAVTAGSSDLRKVGNTFLQVIYLDAYTVCSTSFLAMCLHRTAGTCCLPGWRCLSIVRLPQLLPYHAIGSDTST